MSDTPNSTPKSTRYETTLKLIKRRVIKLNFDLVSGDSSFSSSEGSVDEPKDQSGIDPVKLNFKKCFMLRKSSSPTETSGTSEFINKETTANDLGKVNSCDMLVSICGDTLESSGTSDTNIDEKTFLNVTKLSVNRVFPKKARSSSAKEKTLVCDVCQRGFIRKLFYEKHVLAHRVDKCKNIFNCDLCGKGFPKKQNVTRHFKKVHMPRIFNCGECPKYFRSRSGFRDHKKTCHEPRDELLTCPTCAKIFTLKKNLVYHLRRFPNHDVGTSGYSKECGAIVA